MVGVCVQIGKNARDYKKFTDYNERVANSYKSRVSVCVWGGGGVGVGEWVSVSVVWVSVCVSL